jgi:sulfur relay (sulfurtransferase) DsrC/TusE family protein
MGKQEESRMAEMEAERAQYEVYQKHQDIVRGLRIFFPSFILSD